MSQTSKVKSELTTDLATHITLCPWRVRVETLEAFVVAHQARSGENKTWLDKLWPFIWSAGGIGFYLILLHAAEMLKVIKR